MMIERMEKIEGDKKEDSKIKCHNLIDSNIINNLYELFIFD